MKVFMPYTKRSYQPGGCHIQNREHEIITSIDQVEVCLNDIREFPPPDLRRDGLAVLHWPTSVRYDWLDDAKSEQNKRQYATETAAMLQALTGCGHVAVFDMDMRMSPCSIRDSMTTYGNFTFTKPEGSLGIMVVGVRLTKVEPESVVAGAGLRPGMKILKVNEQDIDDYKGAIAEALKAIPVGGEVRIYASWGFGGASGKGLRDPAGAIHQDQSPLFEADATPSKNPPCCLRHTARPEDSHFMICNVWRSMDYDTPVQRDVLAFCDMSTVEPRDLVHAEAGGAPFVRLAPNPKHKWMYVSNITADEVIVHMQYDTRIEDPTKRAIFHTACKLEGQDDHPEWAPRTSVETRCLLYFEGEKDDDREGRVRRFVEGFQKVAPSIKQ